MSNKVKFSRYPSIDNSYRVDAVDGIYINSGNDEFVVIEKIHGSNFSFWTDGKEVKTAKRSCYIGSTDDFADKSDYIKNKYEQKIKDLREYLDAVGLIADGDTVAVYGELFGGHYPHGDVKNNNKIKTMHSEVLYHPEYEFAGFDIMVKKPDQEQFFVDYDVMVIFFERFGIPTAPLVFKGSFNDCLAYENKYVTKVPALFDLPEIEDNWCEGNIIRAVKESKGGNRDILKNKNDAFSENSRKPNAPRVLPENIKNLVEELRDYINGNRIESYESKEGKIDIYDNASQAKGVGMIIADAVEDYIKDNDPNQLVEHDFWRAVKKRLQGETIKYVREFIINRNKFTRAESIKDLSIGTRIKVVEIEVKDDGSKVPTTYYGEVMKLNVGGADTIYLTYVTYPDDNYNPLSREHTPRDFIGKLNDDTQMIFRKL